MAYALTQDEKNGFYGVGVYDAPYTPQANPAYVLAVDSAGYGASAFSGDIDVYSLGILSSGIYELDVSSYNWDWYTTSFGSLSSFGIADVDGNILYTSVNEFSNLEFSVSSNTTLHAYVIGGTYSTYEYEISYTRTGNINNPAVFSDASVSGDHTAGETISAYLTYADADGIANAVPFFHGIRTTELLMNMRGLVLGLIRLRTMM